MRMELRHLRYFVTVAEELNFRRAAERLNLTRPALSKQLKDLEDELEIKLIERNTVRAKLTDAGTVYLQEARSILEHVNRAATLAREAKAGKRGGLRIGNPGPLAANFLPETLRALREELPHVEVSLADLHPLEHTRALLDDEIDIGFSFGKQAVAKELKRYRIIDSGWGVAMPCHHPLAGRKVLDMADVSGPLLACAPPNGSNSLHAEAIERLYASQQLTPGAFTSVQGFESLVTMIGSGHGITLMSMALNIQRYPDLALVPIRNLDPTLNFELWTVWRENEDSAVVKNFLRILKTRQEKKVVKFTRAG